MSNIMGRGVSFERGCNSRAFRMGYQDCANGKPLRDTIGPKWGPMCEIGRHTVAFARGRGDVAHDVSFTRKLEANVRHAITIQAAQMIAETSNSQFQRIGAWHFLSRHGRAAA